MNYFDPFLAAWLQGLAGQSVAQQSIGLATNFNAVLDGWYSNFGDPVADVETTFQTTNQTPVPFVGLPLDVALVCAWTWMCAAAPQGPNIHANAYGYVAIAATFFHAMPRP